MSWPGMTYTDPGAVRAVAADAAAPAWHCPTGNGRRVPTRWRVRYHTPDRGARWRRVYVPVYGGEPGRPYVVVDGRRLALDRATRWKLRNRAGLRVVA